MLLAAFVAEVFCVSYSVLNTVVLFGKTLLRFAYRMSGKPSTSKSFGTTVKPIGGAKSFGGSGGSGSTKPNGGGFASTGKQPAKPKEDVTLKIHASQLVECVIPFQTPRAKFIREQIKDEIVHDGKLVWMFRDIDGDFCPGWTNVGRSSTPNSVVLTAVPVAAVEATVQYLSNSEHVQHVHLRNGANMAHLTMDDVHRFEFDPLPGQEHVETVPVQFEEHDAVVAQNAASPQWSQVLPITQEDCYNALNVLQDNITMKFDQLQATTKSAVDLCGEQLTTLDEAIVKLNAVAASLTSAVHDIATIHLDKLDKDGATSTPTHAAAKPLAVSAQPPSTVDECRTALRAQNVQLPLDVRPLKFYQDLWTEHIGGVLTTSVPPSMSNAKPNDDSATAGPKRQRKAK